MKRKTLNRILEVLSLLYALVTYYAGNKESAAIAVIVFLFFKFEYIEEAIEELNRGSDEKKDEDKK